MAHLLRIDRAESDLCERTTMAAEGLTETAHLESWLKTHPEVIDDALMVVTTQFGSWASETGSAHERPDILALSSSGELVVIELKRDADRRVHLQALTYGALVAGFTKEKLSEAHARWLSEGGSAKVTPAEALERLEQHVESEWSEELFQLPRLVLVAQEFPAQVLTTVQWLAAVAPDLTVECHEYQLFRQPSGLVASFQRLFPVDDLEDRRLRPIVATEVREQLTTNRRRAKSVTIIYENEKIAAGESLTLQLEGQVKPDSVARVRAWLDADPLRKRVTWSPDPHRPLVWAVQPDQRWTPSALCTEIFAGAGLADPSFSAADAWHCNGDSLYQIASSALTED